MEYFNIEDVIAQSPRTRLFYCIGQRACGKTYSCKRYVIRHYLSTGKKFVYCRRWTTEVQGRELQNVFSDVIDDPGIDWSLYGPSGSFHTMHILPKSGYFWMVGEDDDGNLTWLDSIGKITCIAKAEQFKGGAYNDFDTIIFDEFITEKRYIGGDKEPEFFSKIVNTVGRSKNADLRIFMLGNPDASIEANPYMYSLHLDYARLQPNTIYYFDRKEAKKTYAQNILFIKLANFSGEFLNAGTSNLFGTAEEEMGLSGEVKRNKYIHMDYREDFRPAFELVVETPIITNEEYHKKIYVYYGEIYREPVCVIEGHRTYRNLPTLYCRYDKNDLRPRDCRQTFRLFIPPDMNEWRSFMVRVESNQFFISNDDSNGTLYDTIRTQGIK